jgi:signal transduction histidine kinase
MLRPPKPLHLVTALCLLLQGAALFGTGLWSGAPLPQWPLLPASLAALTAVLCLVLWRRTDRGRRGLLVVAISQAGLVAVLSLGLREGAEPSPSWLQEQRRTLEQAVRQEAESVERLLEVLDHLGTEMASIAGESAEPFALTAALSAKWQAVAGGSIRFPLTGVVWQGGERTGWQDDSAPLPFPADSLTVAGAGLLQRGYDLWYWRRFEPLTLGDGEPAILELQLGLRDTVEDLGGAGSRGWRGLDLLSGRPQIRIEVVPVSDPVNEHWRPDAGGSIQYAVDLPLGEAPVGADAAELRLVGAASSWPLQRHRAAAQRLMLSILLWTVAVVVWCRRTWGGMGLLAGLWLARCLWIGVDFFRWVQPAFPAQRLPALPGEAVSLIDPAYFATPFGGGWLASAADAVLTALLLAATVWLLGRRLLEQTPPPGVDPTAGQPARGSRSAVRRFGRPLFFGLAAGLLLLGVRGIVFEVVENANARLIGPKVPIRFLTFWALHVVLALVAGSVVAALTIWSARWRWRARFGKGLFLCTVGGAAVALTVSDLAPVTRIVLVAVTLVIWWTAPFVLAREFPLRRLSLVAPLLLTVLWNYAVLAEAYGRSELNWLESKGDLIVLSQNDWIQFLMEDVLAEMVPAEAQMPVADPYSREAEELWQNRSAYDLWRRSAVFDWGLPCLVEVLDAEGYSESLFASGFLQDFGYEVLSRSRWRVAEPAGLSPALDIALQTECRRYPTGQEWVLRGEVQRRGRGGWIRLELSVQSKRISTLLARLSGRPGGSPADRYRPRVEIDRPLILLRGDDAGWLDAGPGDFPAAGSVPVVAALKEGRARWGKIAVGTGRYCCLWRTLPESLQSSPGEGFLIGLQIPSVIDRLLDLSRLLMLTLLLLGAWALLSLPWRIVVRGRAGFALGFQERFLVGYLLLGLLLLLLAGLMVDRLSSERLVSEARNRSREGLAAAMAQLQGLLSEQARALAESEYIADLLANRLTGQRPLGPFSARQGMVFNGDGELLLDETLSDLDAIEARSLLTVARNSQLLLMDDGGALYLGTTIPIDLSGVVFAGAPLPADTVTAEPDTATAVEAPLDRRQDGFFFYRQRVGGDLLAGLAEIVQGEVTLRVGGEVVLASHPEQVFSGQTPVMAPTAMIRRLLGHLGTPLLDTSPENRLAFTGYVALPTLALVDSGSQMQRRRLPAVLAVAFPASERDIADQRERAALYLAGLATLIFLTAALLAMLLTWNIFGPVRILVTATRRLAGGDFAAPLPEARRDEIGTLAASFGSMRDELQKAQTTLAARERFLATVLRRVPVGVAVYDVSGGVVAINPAGEAILAEFYGDEEVGNDRRAQALLSGFRDLLGPQEQGEGELRSRDGRRTLRGRLAPLELPAGRRDQMIVFEDVTEFLATKRAALNAELARQVAHEIKNPLTPIQLSVQLMHQAYQDGSPDLDRIVEETLRQVLEQVTLLRSIATEFSLLGRPGELECEPVDLERLVRRVLASYHATGGSSRGEGPRVELAAGPVPTVLGHAESLVKVLGNLMENSLAACGETQSLQLRIGWRWDDRTVTLIWEDNGPGLPAEVADRLFDPYFSTKSQGTGLGLAICRNLLDKMGGSISLKNRADESGAVAEVTLPRPQPAETGSVEPVTSDKDSR